MGRGVRSWFSIFSHLPNELLCFLRCSMADWQAGREIPPKELQKGIGVGSLNKLLLYLSAEGAYGISLHSLLCAHVVPRVADNKLLKTFITTYRSFASPYKLWQKLQERYHVPKGASVDAKKVQLRVSVIVK
jgi:hypothetical protein